MTRFYTEYELKKQDLKLNENLFQNPEKYKEELKVAINEENHRSNVDRAKKKSCAQYFDYDKCNPQDIFSGNFVPTVEDNNKINKRLEDSMTLSKFKIEFKKFETPVNKINYLYDNFNKESFFELFNVDIIDADLFTGLILNIGLYLKETKEKVKNDKNEFLFFCLDVLEKAKYFQKYKMFIGKKHKAPFNEIITNEDFINSIPISKQVINKIIK